MLEAIVGSTGAERVLLFLVAREEGYATEIARVFDTSLSPVQKQLDRMERGGLLINKKVGRIRLYQFNPCCPFVDELRQLLNKALPLLPVQLQSKLLLQ